MTRLATLLFALLTPVAAMADCTHDRQTAMSCAEGTAMDPETGTCVPTTTS